MKERTLASRLPLWASVVVFVVVAVVWEPQPWSVGHVPSDLKGVGLAGGTCSYLGAGGIGGLASRFGLKVLYAPVDYIIRTFFGKGVLYFGAILKCNLWLGKKCSKAQCYGCPAAPSLGLRLL